MKKLPRDLRLATMEERSTFNAKNNCIAIRVYADIQKKGLPREMACPNRQLPGTGGLCIGHARELLEKDEWQEPQS